MSYCKWKWKRSVFLKTCIFTYIHTKKKSIAQVIECAKNVKFCEEHRYNKYKMNDIDKFWPNVYSVHGFGSKFDYLSVQTIPGMSLYMPFNTRAVVSEFLNFCLNESNTISDIVILRQKN